jgi:stage V sporulation protein G
MAELAVVRLRRFDDRDDSKLKAFADIAIGDFVVKGFRVVQGQKGLFLGFPQEKGKDGKWYNVLWPKTKEARQDLTDLVLSAYEEGG